jgi:N-acetylneuraminate synthase
VTSTLIIAEAGVNHDGSVETALELIDVAADAGADVVKFQTFRADALATASTAQAAYQRERAAASGQLEMLRALQLDRGAHEQLAARCADREIEFLSTAFDEESLGWLLELGVRRIKVPSGELTNGPLLLAFARTGLPLLVSTGMANLGDVEAALSVIAYGRRQPVGAPSSDDLRLAYGDAARSGDLQRDLTILHCTSSYPAAPEDVNLTAMDTLRAAFGVEVGYSDHTLGTLVGLAAVARGASVLEKHVTLDRSRPGPDHAASLEPNELRELVIGVRTIEAALGRPTKHPTPAEQDSIVAARRSVVAARPIRAGQLYAAADLRATRPGGGRSPLDLWGLIGRPAPRDYAPDEPVD